MLPSVLLVAAHCPDDRMPCILVHVFKRPCAVDGERVVSPHDVRVARYGLAGHRQHAHLPGIGVDGPLNMGDAQVMISGEVAHHAHQRLGDRDHGHPRRRRRSDFSKWGMLPVWVRGRHCCRGKVFMKPSNWLEG